MARRFVRIDISEIARDFRPVAVEPGLALLDPALANAKMVSRWLGRFAGDPEWQETAINFYVQDDQGGRLEEVYCQPATREDLNESLADELSALRDRLARVRPDTKSEQTLYHALAIAFRELSEDPLRTDLDDYFFWYRDVNGHRRLVWCWGFQRIDQETAPAIVCSDPDCNLLFLRRPGRRNKCPSCQAALEAGRGKTSHWKRYVALLLLLLLLLGGLAWYWFRWRNDQIAERTPVKLEAVVKPAAPVAGDTGVVVVTGKGPQGDTPIATELLSFKTSDAKILAVDERLGEFRAVAPGEATVTVAHPAAADPIEVKIKVLDRASAPRKETVVGLKILSDQGQAVSFPVGAQFDDFRVVAEYPNGVTRLVTRRATLRPSQSADVAPISASRGKLLGVRPGQTVLGAEFEGVRTDRGLDVTVAGQVEIDEIRIAPSPALILPGESLTLDAVGYQGGKSVGSLTALPGLTWKAAGDAIQAQGAAVTGVKPGQATVTAQRGSVESQPGTVSVVASIADQLTVDPKAWRMRVGESREIGSDVLVHRGQLDVSRMAAVHSPLADVLRYDPPTGSLTAVAPGTAAVLFTLGDKMARAVVEVEIDAGGGAIVGDVVLEPGSVRLAAGQMVPMRAFVLAKEGGRFDRTAAAVLVSSDPAKTAIIGSDVCGVAAGAAKITASVAGAEQSASAYVTVTDEPITELSVEPSRMALSVGDTARLRILGRAASGTYELFPQKDLIVTAGGANPQAIKIIGTTDLKAVAPGEAAVIVRWKGALSASVPVTVSADRWTDLRIEPLTATITPGDRLLYQVTALRGGRRHVLGPAEGLRLAVENPTVAETADNLNVLGKQTGRTGVTARLEGLEANAELLVSPPGAVPLTYDDFGHLVVPGDVIVRRGGRGYGYLVDGGSTVVVPGDVVLDRLWIEPGAMALQRGQSTPRLRVLGSSGGGTPFEVPAALESLDRSVLVPDSAEAAQFTAVGTGGTQIRADYRGREAFANVTVTGGRFLSVDSRLAEGSNDFTVSLDVTAAPEEGAVEYRVYEAGKTPPERWQPSAEVDGRRRATLQSGPIPYGDRNARYHLMIEARDSAGRSVQNYPFTFRLVPNIQRTEPPR